MSSNVKNGIVKWFDDQKGFGFIKCDNKDYFVHFREIKTKGFKTLTEGMLVQFDVGESKKGPIAVNVTVD
jgi:CspA family cold shock protein